MPPGTDIEVLPHSGQVIDLNDTGAVAEALREVREMEARLRSAKSVLTDALVAQSARLGSKTLRLEAGKVEVKGGTETVYDAQAIKRELLEAGMPAFRVAEIVVETLDYRVDARKATSAGKANPEYAAIIERHKKVYPKRPTVTVS